MIWGEKMEIETNKLNRIKEGVTHYNLFKIIHERRAVTMTQLRKEGGYSTYLSNIIKRLEQEKYVCRKTINRRMRIIELTNDGEKLLYFLNKLLKE